MKKIINQQETLQKDTSETKSDKNDVYYELPNKSFLNWFIGLCESNENIFTVNRRYLRFELNYPLKNSDVLYYIKKKLKFGKIKKIRFLDGIIVEYSVQADVNSLLILVHIFNGNLRCAQKEQYFKIFYNKLKVKLKKMNLLYLLPDYISNIKVISLNDSWLCGFIENRGLLYGRMHKSKKLILGKEIFLVIYLWHLDDKVLLQIKNLLNSSSKIENKEKWNLPFFKLSLESFDEKSKIIKYLSTFKLKSLKIERYKMFKKLLKIEKIYLNTGVQNLEKIEKMLKVLTLKSNENELIKL
jgi:hypothetical protein